MKRPAYQCGQVWTYSYCGAPLGLRMITGVSSTGRPLSGSAFLVERQMGNLVAGPGAPWAAVDSEEKSPLRLVVPETFNASNAVFLVWYTPDDKPVSSYDRNVFARLADAVEYLVDEIPPDASPDIAVDSNNEVVWDLYPHGSMHLERHEIERKS